MKFLSSIQNFQLPLKKKSPSIQRKKSKKKLERLEREFFIGQKAQEKLAIRLNKKLLKLKLRRELK